MGAQYNTVTVKNHLVTDNSQLPHYHKSGKMLNLTIIWLANKSIKKKSLFVFSRNDKIDTHGRLVLFNM